MFYVYVLKCTLKNTNDSDFYIGFTGDLKERLNDHKSGSVETTRKFDKIELIYYEASLNKTDAMHREKQLKTGFGRGYIKRRLQNYLKQARD